MINFLLIMGYIFLLFIYLVIFNWMPDFLLVAVFYCLPLNHVRICSGMQVGYRNQLDTFEAWLSIVNMELHELVV